MKNVAATSGQSVSFATRFFGMEIACVGYCVGRDKELNFYYRPPSDTHSRAAGKRVRNRRIQESPLHARKICMAENYFLRRLEARGADFSFSLGLVPFSSVRLFAVC
jgi:hypothetical protein